MIENIEVAPGVALAVDAAAPSHLPTLLCSNSIGADLHMWDDIVPMLSNKVRLIRYDTRGHGQSGIGAEPLSIDTLGQDILAILDRLGIERAFLCGLSLGGLTAQWLGAEHSHRFHGIILANTAANFPPDTMWYDRAKAVRVQGIGPLLSPTLDRWFTKSFQQSNQARMADIAAMIVATSREGYARCCEVLAATDLSGAITKIPVPVRVICGAHDPSTTPARGEELVRLIPQADMITLNAAHISAVEAAADFAKAVDDFIGANNAA